MRLINSSWEILEQAPGIEGVYKQVEKAARTCYKSEDKITDDSYKKFLKMLYDRGHWACFEQGTVYLKVSVPDVMSYIPCLNYYSNQYSTVYSNQCKNETIYYITSNLRVLLENNWLNNLKYICEPTEYHEKRICVRFILSNGIGREFTRHRAFSFMQESTRYVRYDGSKDTRDITFIIPSHLDLMEGTYVYDRGKWNVLYHPDNDPILFNKELTNTPDIDEYLFALKRSEDSYTMLLHSGWTPQQARGVLMLDGKTELIMTGTITQWKSFFKLRTDNAAHPDARALAIPLQEEFIKRGYIKDEK